jgi:hypothetical protein
MIEELIALADDLDILGLIEASDEIDQIIKESAKKGKGEKKRVPTDKALWSRALAEARKKFKVYPCVPVKDSYILAEDGWKTYYDVRVGDKVLTYNKDDDYYEWGHINKLHFYKKADTVRLVSDINDFNFICTPDHKWVISGDNGFELAPTVEIDGSKKILVSSKNTRVELNKSIYNFEDKYVDNINIYKIGKMDVWCPETNNGTWVMKQGSLSTITGNSAYANGWAAKWYKEKGGGWRGPKPIK